MCESMGRLVCAPAALAGRLEKLCQACRADGFLKETMLLVMSGGHSTHQTIG